MSIARLRWRKEAGRFVAYPMGSHHAEMIATLTPICGSWVWRVAWPNWFVEYGFSEDKQSATDAATGAWWKCVATEGPVTFMHPMLIDAPAKGEGLAA